MVRTQSRVTSVPFDLSRIFAYSTALALHALALGLLLIPLSQAPIRSTAVQEPRWQIPAPRVLPPPPPLPPEAVLKPSSPIPMRPPALPVAVAVETTPLPVFAVEAVIAPPTDIAPPLDSSAASIDSGVGTALGGVALRYLRAPAPAYPRDALLANAQGTVILRVRVDAEGLPVEVSVERGSGNRSLDNAARRQVLRHWRFQPATEQGQTVQAWGLVPVEFKLN